MSKLISIIATICWLVGTAQASCYSCRHRSWRARHQFEVMTGHPYGWPGHIIDHKIPLACGGTDSPRNMQWQTTSEAKAKDSWERERCAQKVQPE